MGTNFYLDRKEKIHIGKRSAAGRYCYDCDDTLCPRGKDQVHAGSLDDPPWPKDCPRCGAKEVTTDSLNSGPVAVELGFAKPAVVRPTGIAGASSFSWAIDPIKVLTLSSKKSIYDEYGRKMTKAQFAAMLQANCPIQFYSSIGREFC